MPGCKQSEDFNYRVVDYYLDLHDNQCSQEDRLKQTIHHFKRVGQHPTKVCNVLHNYMIASSNDNVELAKNFFDEHPNASVHEAASYLELDERSLAYLRDKVLKSSGHGFGPGF